MCYFAAPRPQHLLECIMNFSGKLILAGLAVSLLALPACEHHDRHRRPGGGKGLAGGCGGLACGQGPGAGHKYGRMDRTFEVYIYTVPLDSSKCDADVDIATLWKQKNGHPKQTITWFSDDGKDYVVDFSKGHNGSPFALTSIPVPGAPPGNTGASSGDLNSGSSGYYDFAILAGKDHSAPVCKQPSDPGYYVKP